MDELGQRLLAARASGAAFARSERHAPWGLELPPTVELAVHAVVEGGAWIWFEDPAEALELRAGDLALVRGSFRHRLADAAGSATVPLERFPEEADAGEGPRSVFFCGAYKVSGDVASSLLEALPPVLRVRPPQADPLRTTTALLSAELADPRGGQQVVLDRLLDVMLAQLLRRALSEDAARASRWRAAAVDERVSAALAAIHEDPGRNWTVELLAAEAQMSRTAFTRAFRRALRQSPIRYLTELRMRLAREALLETAAPLAAVASQAGYSSQYAFAAAFRRHHGVAPGRWRQQQAVGSGL